MAPHMVIIVPEPTGYAGIKHVAVSLPRIAWLIDHEKWLEPEDVPEPEIRDMRRLRRHKGPRSPSLRTLVRWAIRCDTAEQLGERLRQRYERQARRAGDALPRRTDAEDRQVLDRLLDDAIG